MNPFGIILLVMILLIVWLCWSLYRDTRAIGKGIIGALRKIDEASKKPESRKMKVARKAAAVLIERRRKKRENRQ